MRAVFPHRPRLASLALALASSLALAPEARAWDAGTRARLADEAVRFMPAGLRLALERHRVELQRGTLAPAGSENESEHRAGTLAERLDAEARGLGEAIEAGAPFDEVARRFGALAHYVADLGFPPAAAIPADPRRYRHFASFCESRRGRFPLVFYGHADAGFPPGGWQGWARAVLERTRGEDLELARAYAKAGDPPAAIAFDDRSVPFAIGSLAYSRSCTNVVRAWLAVWTAAGGDTGSTPYLPRAARAPHAGSPP